MDKKLDATLIEISRDNSQLWKTGSGEKWLEHIWLRPSSKLRDPQVGTKAQLVYNKSASFGLWMIGEILWVPE